MTNRKLALALAASLVLPALPARAEPLPPPRIVVTGEGEMAVRPDLAIVSLGVMREAMTAREALDANNSAMARVIAAMKEAGIAERDLQTAGLQIMPRYTYTNKPDGTQEAELVGYQVTNTLSVRIRELAKAGEILDQAVSLGVNVGGGISFTNDDPAAALQEARRRAVADAMTKAHTLGQAAGVALGRIIEITDTNVVPPPMPFMAKAMVREAADSVPIEAGENSYRVQVNLTFELK